ncbi:MAG: ParB/RepB/Spo0J family partition protein [bacterium]
MKKNILKGGIMSLIPKRDVEDADDVLDRIEEEEVVIPEKPLVTPLTIDVDEDDVEEEKKEKKEKVSVITVEESEEEEIEEPEEEVKELGGIEEQEEAEESGVKPGATLEAAAMWDKHEGDVQHVAIDDIQINRSQPRRKFEKVEMQELTDSVAQHGILQPLVVRRGKSGSYDLVAGERRLRAAKSLGWERVPCVVRRDVRSEAARIEMALIENIQREDLNPIEEALAYQQLNEEYGMTHEEIGQRVGRSRVGITNTIRVLQLPDEVRRGLIDGTISAGHARAILMIPDEEKQKRFYSHLVAEGLTVRKAETRARRIQRSMNLDDPLRRKRRGRTAFEVEYSGKLEDTYGFDTRLRFNEDKNRFEIMFKCHSQRDIEELLGRLLGTRPLPDKVDKDVIENKKAS